MTLLTAWRAGSAARIKPGRAAGRRLGRPTRLPQIVATTALGRYLGGLRRWLGR